MKIPAKKVILIVALIIFLVLVWIIIDTNFYNWYPDYIANNQSYVNDSRYCRFDFDCKIDNACKPANLLHKTSSAFIDLECQRYISIGPTECKNNKCVFNEIYDSGL